MNDKNMKENRNFAIYQLCVVFLSLILPVYFCFVLFYFFVVVDHNLTQLDQDEK